MLREFYRKQKCVNSIKFDVDIILIFRVRILLLKEVFEKNVKCGFFIFSYLIGTLFLFHIRNTFIFFIKIHVFFFSEFSFYI